MKKFICIMLTAILGALSISTFAACGGADESYDASNFMTAEEARAAGTPYRIVKDPVTIKIFVPKGDSNPGYNNLQMFKELSRQTHLIFDFIEAPSDQYTTIRNAIWQDRSSPDFPDLFLFSNSVSEMVQFSNYGALVPFDDPSYSKNGLQIGSLIDNYMPTLKLLLDTNFANFDKDYYHCRDGQEPVQTSEGLNTLKTAREVLKLADGKIYSTPTVIDVPRDLSPKLYINQKWIEELNAGELRNDPLPNAGDIRTIEELDRVLRAFKTYNASGRNETIPLISDCLDNVRNYVLASYGYVSNSVEINKTGDGFVYVPKEEAYRKYLQIMREWYRDGIIDNATAFSSDSGYIRQKGSTGVVGAFCAAAAYLVVGENYGEQAGDGCWYTTAGPFTSEYYQGPALQYGIPQIRPGGAIIPSTTKYAREVARLLDIMYSKLGVSLFAFGKEGQDWRWTNKNTKTAWFKTIPSDWTKTEEDYRALLTPTVGLGVSLYNCYDFVGKEVSPRQGEICVTQKLNELAERYVPYLKEAMPSYLKLRSMNDYNRESKIGVTLIEKVKEYEYKFINTRGGKNPNSDADWNAYVNELVNYQCEEWVGLYNAALANY